MSWTLSKLKFLGGVALAASLAFSCKKKEDPQPVEEEKPVVTTADSLRYQEATFQFKMFTELINKTKEGNTVGKFVDSVTLKKMFNNTGAPFANGELNSSAHKLIDAVAPELRPLLLSYFIQLSEASKSQRQGAKDTAGVVYNSGATTGKLYDPKGHAVYELIEKGLMGGFQTYQIAVVQLSDVNLNASSVDAKLKNWDMAFAYLGVPKTFTSTTTGYSFWGSYLRTNDEILGGSISKIMSAFADGRKASESNDNTTAKAKAQIIREELDKNAAGMAMTYLFRARKYSINLDAGRKNGTLSEGKGFLSAIKFNPARKLQDADFNEIVALLGTNNWDTPVEDIQKALDKLGLAYGFDSNPETSKFNK